MCLGLLLAATAWFAASCRAQTGAPSSTAKTPLAAGLNNGVEWEEEVSLPRGVTLQAQHVEALGLTWTRYSSTLDEDELRREYEATIYEEAGNWVVIWMPAAPNIIGGGMVFRVDRKGKRILQETGGQ